MDNFESYVDSKFQKEINDSAISEDVVALNIYNLGDTSYVVTGQEDVNEDLEFLIDSLKLDGGSKEDRNNSGRISTSILNYARKMRGGWYNAPFYGLAERATTDYFYFKPNVAPKDYKGKISKYVGATGVSPRLMTPNVPESIWAVIACRYNVEKTGAIFWEWILDHPEIPVIIGEGFKTSLSGISASYPTASINGCHGGSISIKEDDGKSQGHQLIPDLKVLAEGGRTIYLALDRDISGKTKQTVQKATRILAGLLAEQGCEVYSIKWDANSYKGLDDFIAGAGVDAFKLAIENATNITPLPKTEKQKLPPPLDVADVVSERLFNKIRYEASTKQWWKYDGKGKWAHTYESSVFKSVHEYLKETLPAFLPSYVDNVIKFARSSSLIEVWEETSSLDFLPFINGVLNLKTHELLPHSPDYSFTWRLPRSYSVLSTDWHHISDFLDIFTGFNKQLKDLALAFCNAVLKGRSDLQKFLYLFGSGANGKGAYMTLLRILIGNENTHATTLKELNENRFESANLKGKRLVLMSDEDKRPGGIGVFKSITGQDPVRYERKGKDSTNFIFTGVAVMAANSPTFVGDNTDAVYRRKVAFPCLVKVEECDRRDLVPEFTSDLPAFTNFLLSLPDEWVTNTIRGANKVEAVKKLNWEMSIREDSIAAFLDAQLIIDPDESVSSSDVYSSYQMFCVQNGLKPKSQTNFTPGLIELGQISLGYNISKRKTNKGNFFQGMRLRSPTDPYSVEEETIPRAESGGCGGLVEATVEGSNPCLETRVEGVEGYSPFLKKDEKKVDEEVVLNSYHLHTQKKVTLESNVEIPSIPSIPSTPNPEVLLDKTSRVGNTEGPASTLPPYPPLLELKVGDRVEYIGSDRALQAQYAGVLEVVKVSQIDGYTCRMINGRGFTSWIDPKDLRLVAK